MDENNPGVLVAVDLVGLDDRSSRHDPDTTPKVTWRSKVKVRFHIESLIKTVILISFFKRGKLPVVEKTLAKKCLISM